MKRLFLFIAVVIILPQNVRAQEIIQPTLVERINSARDLLEEVHVATTMAKAKNGKVTAKIQSREVVLAVEFTPNGKVTLVHLKEKGGKYQSVSSRFTVKVPKDNGVNTNYQVWEASTGKSGLVLAGKYPLLVGGKLEQAIYTPYTKTLHQTELVDAGRSYLEAVVESAYADLAEHHVRSAAFPERLVTEVIPEDLMQQLAVIEHLDPAAFSNSDSLSRLLGKFFVIVGSNEGGAFAYTKSRAGAFGMMQFIPSTYKFIRGRYPEAELETDFITGMQDHENAVEAAVLLADHNLTQLSKDHRQYMLENNDDLAEYVAASYNTGASRVVKALAYRGANWQDDTSVVRKQKEQQKKKLASQITQTKRQLASAKTSASSGIKQSLVKLEREHAVVVRDLANLKKASLKAETVVYLKKLRAVAEGLKGDVS